MSESFKPNPIIALIGMIAESTGVITGNNEELTLCLTIKCDTEEGFIGMLHLLEMFKGINIDG